MWNKITSPLVILGVLLLDRISKILVLDNFYYGQLVPVFPFFNLTYVENTGVAFGLGQDKNAFFIFIAGALAVAVVGWRCYVRNIAPKWEKLGLDLIIGGALGNLYDRIAHKAVIDFLDIYVGQWHWPAFNVADSAICMGACFLILAQYRSER